MRTLSVMSSIHSVLNQMLFTSQEVTGYYAKSQAKHFSQILDVVSDIYLNSTFPKSEIEKEKGVVIEEMNMYEDMPIRRVQEHFLSLMYGDQPAGRSIIGTKDTVRAISRNDLIAYHKAHYVGEGTVIVVAGDIPTDAQKQIAKVFGTIPHAKKTKRKKVTDVQKAPQVAVIQKMQTRHTWCLVYGHTRLVIQTILSLQYFQQYSAGNEFSIISKAS